jgi:hypothetical protein
MKRLLILLLFCLCCPLYAWGQSNPPIRVTELDGSPTRTNPTQLIFPNGSLSITGGRVTISSVGGGATPTGNDDDLQKKNGAALAASGLNDDGTLLSYTGAQYQIGAVGTRLEIMTDGVAAAGIHAVGDTLGDIIAIDLDGKFVAIGKAGPEYKLDVGGTIRADTGILVGTEDDTLTVGGAVLGSQFKAHTEDIDDLAQLLLMRHHDFNLGSAVVFARSGGDIATQTIVADNSTVMNLLGVGHDGTDFERVAAILAEVDGTPGANDMPGRLVFQTVPDGSATLATRMTIKNDGLVDVAGTLSAATLRGTALTDDTVPKVDSEGNIIDGLPFTAVARNDQGNSFTGPDDFAGRVSHGIQAITYASPDSTIDVSLGNIGILTVTGNTNLRITNDTIDMQLYVVGLLMSGAGHAVTVEGTEITDPRNVAFTTGTTLNTVTSDGAFTYFSMRRNDRTGVMEIEGFSNPVQATIADIGGGAAPAEAFDFGAASSFEIPNGAGGTTVDATGEITIDSTSGSVNFFDGTAERRLDPLQSKSFVIANPAATDDFPFWRVPYNITIVSIRCLTTGGTNVIGGLDEADANGANPVAVDADITATAGTNANDDGSLTNPTIDATDYLNWHTTSVSGSPTFFTVTVNYRIDP